jgi:hypothetical protein
VPNKVALVKAVYWWNNTNCDTCYWYAQYTSTTATLFIANIVYGSYSIYDRQGNGNWSYHWDVDEGGAGTLFNYGVKKNRGFRGDAAGVDSQADIVMYFFR